MLICEFGFGLGDGKLDWAVITSPHLQLLNPSLMIYINSPLLRSTALIT
uniref:Uncharacterized protein n=1 Tax=Rhizophora mucronata TaxID=61149 RepID=A0A2P2NEA8_RHIMU